MRFMMLLKSDEQSETGAMPSEEIVSAMMKYNEDLVKAGALLAAEGLRPSSYGARVKFHGGKPTVIDGPFTEAKELVAGFWIIQANSKEEAIEWAKRIPFEAGEASYPEGGMGQVEIRPLFELEDFPVNEDESGWREQEAEYRATTPAWPEARPGYKKFMGFRMADKETEAGAPPSEEILAAMGAYMDEGIKAGLVLAGEGLKPSSESAKVIYSRGKRTVIDGPFTEAKELIAGFSLLQARSKEELIEYCKLWPANDGGGEVELRIREVFMADDFAAGLSPELRAQEERLRAQVAGQQPR